MPRPILDPASFEAECRRRGVDWPSLAIQQFLYDHGTKGEFLEQYGHLNLLSLRWELVTITALELLGCTYHRDFSRVPDTARDPRSMLARYRQAYGYAVWDGSWKVPPLVLNGSLCDPPQLRPHLIEGHTRLGVLIGLVRLGEVSPESIHEVLFASQ